MDLFAPLPENLSDLTAEQLLEHIAAYRATISRLAARDEELTAEMTDADLLAHAETGTTAVLAMQAEIEARESLAAETDAALAAFAEQAGATDDDPRPGESEESADEETTDDEAEDEDDAEESTDAEAEAEDSEDAETGEGSASQGEGAEEASEAVEEQAEAVVAAGSQRRKTTKPGTALARGTRPPARNKPAPRGAGTQLVGRADVPGMPMGEITFDQGVQGMMDVFSSIRGSRGDGAKFPVMKARIRYPEERQLLPGNMEGNTARLNVEREKHVKNVRDMLRAKASAKTKQALVAAGGLCAPVTPYYDLAQISVADRPVRDSLFNFQATRGGITFAPPPALSAITTGVGIVTEADDAVGGTTAAKTSQHIDCPDFTTVTIDAVFEWLEFGNSGARAWPEQVAQFIELADAAHARVAETKLLDRMDALKAQAVTTANIIGAIGDVLDAVTRMAVAYRSRHRMADQAPLDVWMPEWVPDMLLIDAWRSQFYRMDWDRSTIEQMFAKVNVRVTWYKDTVTSAGQVFGSQGAGAALHFPSTMVWFIAPPGTVGFLDGGELDIGLYRDGDLIEVNDYAVFSETFENLFFLGHQLFKVTSTICPTGETSGPIDVACGS